MKACIPDYHIQSAHSLNEALRLLDDKYMNFKLLAGGTDLMVLLEAGLLPAGNYLSLWGLADLRRIDFDSETITIGALSTYADIRKSALLAEEFPMLGEAAKVTGALAIQNRGTIGGNIANASPAADSPPALLCYDAELEIASMKGVRQIPYKQFHQGYKKIDLLPGELITRIFLTRGKNKFKSYYHKVGTREAQSISKVCFAGLAECSGKKVGFIRLALGSVAPIPLRAQKTEHLLKGKTLDQDIINKAVQTLDGEIAPIDDIRSNQLYRRRVAGNLLRTFLESL